MIKMTFPYLSTITQPFITMTRKLMTACCFLSALIICLSAAFGEHFSRQSISLDGTWQIAEGKLDTIPDAFSRTVPVPGLVDMAEPTFLPPPKLPAGERRYNLPKDPNRDAYWYRREFNLEVVPPLARLKIHKAMFGTKVILNGKEIGEYPSSFTPAYYDVTEALKKGRNEILIRIGADMQSVLNKAVIPWDDEKTCYMPGIFDSIELICTEKLFVENIQTVPDIKAGKVHAQIRLVNKGSEKKTANLALRVMEYKSKKTVGNATVTSIEVAADGDGTVDTSVTITDCKLWSPESPFLYVFEVATESDHLTTRFGMRSFRFNLETQHAELNGKPYFMRGTNFTLYRFFEDEDRKMLPWNRDWVQLLHERVKEMHWNSIRYCIGFPPEFWYDIADEVGILIQDEFPIWIMNEDQANEWLDTDQLVAEYADWMRERWNHPCVVVWDACNETTCAKTGAAIAQVRGLDLSNRPWDNGWNPPAEPGDALELHPYHYQNPNFRFANMQKVAAVPQGGRVRNNSTHAVINNEYGWLWLNRDGTPTTLTSKLYQNLLGPDSTTEQRFYTYAMYLAAETEFFRAHRQCAAVMHFVMLGYSRPDGETSDHWTNVTTLEWEPLFLQYVRDAFSPVGLMLDHWNDRLVQGKDITGSVPIILINDLETPWKGPVKCRIIQNGRSVWEKETQAEMEPYGTTTVTFEVALPQELGAYRMEASIIGNDKKPVRSVRDFRVLDPSMASMPIKNVSASSTHDAERHPASKTLADNNAEYWSSAFQDDAWITFDLGEQKKVSRVVIHWEHAHSLKFDIKVSKDAKTWTEVFKQDNGQGGEESIKFAPVDCRYLRIDCRERAMKQYGNAIYYVEIFEK